MSNNLIADPIREGSAIHVGSRFGAEPFTGHLWITNNTTVRAGTYESYLRGTLQLPSQGPIPSAIENPLVVTYGTDAEAIDDLARGDGVRLDAVISALPTLEEAIDHGEPIKVVGAPLYTEELAVAILKDAPLDATSLVQRVSQIIQEMHADGTLTSLSDKWYGTDLTVVKGPAGR